MGGANAFRISVTEYESDQYKLIINAFTYVAYMHVNVLHNDE